MGKNFLNKIWEGMTHFLESDNVPLSDMTAPYARYLTGLESGAITSLQCKNSVTYNCWGSAPRP